MKKINRLVGSDSLKEENIHFLIHKFNIVGFDSNKKFPNNMFINETEVFRYLMKDPRYIGQNFIFEIEDCFEDIEHFVNENIDHIKKLLFCIILIKSEKVKKDPENIIKLISDTTKETSLNKKFNKFCLSKIDDLVLKVCP